MVVTEWQQKPEKMYARGIALEVVDPQEQLAVLTSAAAQLQKQGRAVTLEKSSCSGLGRRQWQSSVIGRQQQWWCHHQPQGEKQQQLSNTQDSRRCGLRCYNISSYQAMGNPEFL